MALNVLAFIVIFVLQSVFSLSSGVHDGHCEEVNNGSLVCTNVIPETISEHILNVTLKGFTGKLVLSESSFVGNGWGNIKTLEIVNFGTFDDRAKLHTNCFSHLLYLEELRLNITPNSFDNGLFNGLRNVTILDLSDSHDVSQDELLNNLKSPGVLPSLQRLILSRVGTTYQVGFNLSYPFWEMVSARPIFYLDVSYMHLTSLDTTALMNNCHNITHLIGKGTLFGGLLFDVHVNRTVCPKLKLVDLDSIQSSGNIYCIFPGIHDLKNFVIRMNRIITFSKAETVILNNLCGDRAVPKIFKNITGAVVQSPVPWNTKELFFDSNHVKHLDLQIDSSVLTLEKISLRANALEFISPSTLRIMNQTLKYIDLSRNRLHKMVEDHCAEFENIFTDLYKLTFIGLAENGLETIPKRTFSNNTLIRHLDLSQNNLYSASLKTSIPDLMFLNLSYNKFTSLDTKTFDTLNSMIFNTQLKEMNQFKVNLIGNAFHCQKCGDKETIQWLMNNNKHLYQPEDILCLNSNKAFIRISADVLHELNEECEKPIRRRIAIIGSAISLVLLSGFVILLVIIRKYRLKRQMYWRIQDLIGRIKEGRKEHEFLVFMSFCGIDEDFVNTVVREELQKNLNEATKVNRNLICEGDRHFRVGQAIHNEMVYCMNRSTVVLIILMDNFLRSDFCMLEFDQAYHSRKPIILMVPDNVSDELMLPAMKELFKTRARILWRRADDGQYILKSSWENVCRSILHVAVADNKQW